jgi:hypothetical protein
VGEAGEWVFGEGQRKIIERRDAEEEGEWTRIESRVEIEEGFLTSRTSFGMTGWVVGARWVRSCFAEKINVGTQWMGSGSCRMLGLWRN